MKYVSVIVITQPPPKDSRRYFPAWNKKAWKVSRHKISDICDTLVFVTFAPTACDWWFSAVVCCNGGTWFFRNSAKRFFSWSLAPTSHRALQQLRPKRGPPANPLPKLTDPPSFRYPFLENSENRYFFSLVKFNLKLIINSYLRFVSICLWSCTFYFLLYHKI